LAGRPVLKVNIGALQCVRRVADQILFRLGFSLILFILADWQVKQRIDDKAMSNILFLANSKLR
jgi:hypothetical protein